MSVLFCHTSKTSPDAMATWLRVSLIILFASYYFDKGFTETVNDYGKYSHFIAVSSQGHDNATCLNASTLDTSIQNPCKTLKFAFNSTRDDTLYFLEPGIHELVENKTFNGTNNIEILGRNHTNVTIQCTPEVGFTFVRSETITIRGIQFTDCGRLHQSTIGSAFEPLNRTHFPFIAGVFFAYCKDVSILYSVITNSHGIGLILYDVGGKVDIIESTFSRNAPDANNNCTGQDLFYTRAGGGIYVEFTYEGPLPPFNKSDPERFYYQNNSTYNIESCTFEENLAPEQCFMNKIEFPSGNDHMPFGRGGGLSFFIKGTTKNNIINIDNCNFVRNHAVWGSGLFIEIQDSSQNNTINIVGSNFTSNWNSTAGGGIRTGIPIWERKLIANRIIHERCTFTNNSAILGGGVSHYGPNYRPFDENDDQREVLYKKCTWIRNKATLGSAIGLATSALELPLTNLNPDIKGPMIPYKATFEDCKLIGNLIIKTEDEIVIGQGALYSYTVPIVVKGNTIFEGNINTALVMDGVIMKVFNTTSFMNNTGMSGGAIGMYGMSVIDLMPGSKLLFKNNTAKEKGGAIFVDLNGPPVVAFNTTELNMHPCFIAYNDRLTMQHVEKWQTSITFDSNNASLGGGKSVYASSLQGCRRPGEQRKNNQSLEWPSIVHFHSDIYKPVDIGIEIATDPIYIEIDRTDWQMSPGEKFEATIKLVGEKNRPVQGVVKLNVDSTSDAILGIPSPLLLIKDIDTTNKVPGLIMKGTCGSVFNLTLRTVSGQTISTEQNNLELFKCNPGFHLDPDEKECVCKDILGIARCSDDKRGVYIKSGYWAGIVEKTFDTYACPLGYCRNNNSTKREFLLDSNDQCQNYRNNSVPLCGQCFNNYSVTLGSEQCVSTKHCNKERIWLLLVFFLLMLIAVLLVLKINIDIFTVYLNVWLYSYQIIRYLIKEKDVFDPFISFVIGLANWKFHMTGFCFIPGLTNFYKLAINYIVPFYVLFVLLVLSKISRLFPRCYINRNVSHALCNLLVLCYTDITTISFNILHYVDVGRRYVLFLDGNIDFVNDWKTHLPFTILAILLVFFFVFLLPMTLLFTRWFSKWFPFMTRFRLFFDLFQSCFEDIGRQRNYRWFASFYFFCRIWILLMALYLPLGPLKRSILEASCMLVLATCLYFKPYNTTYNWLNTTDAILLGNLCLITVFSSAFTSDASTTTISVLKVVVNILAYVPLVYLIALAVYYGREYILECQGRQRHVRLLNEPSEEDKPRSSGGDVDENTRLLSNHPL